WRPSPGRLAGSSIRASAEQQMLTADERREIAGEILRGVCDVVHRSHSRHRSVRLHGVTVRRVNTLTEDPGTFGRCRKDRLDRHASMTELLAHHRHEVLAR